MTLFANTVRPLFAVSLTAVAIALTACGGGGGDDTGPTPAASATTPSGGVTTDPNAVANLTYSTGIQARWPGKTFTIYYDPTNQPTTMRPDDPTTKAFLPAAPTDQTRIEASIKSAIDQWNAACPGMHAVYGGNARAGMYTNTISWVQYISDPDLAGAQGDLGVTYSITDPSGTKMVSAQINMAKGSIDTYVVFNEVILHELGHAYGLLRHTAYQYVPGDESTDSVMDLVLPAWDGLLKPGDLTRCAAY